MIAAHQRDGDTDEVSAADKPNLQTGGGTHNRIQRHHAMSAPESIMAIITIRT